MNDPSKIGPNGNSADVRFASVADPPSARLLVGAARRQDIVSVAEPHPLLR
jgi:hypothetical protein